VSGPKDFVNLRFSNFVKMVCSVKEIFVLPAYVKFISCVSYVVCVSLVNTEEKNCPNAVVLSSFEVMHLDNALLKV